MVHEMGTVCVMAVERTESTIIRIKLRLTASKVEKLYVQNHRRQDFSVIPSVIV